MARRLGWQQTKVSKLELGTQLPTPSELGIRVAAVGAGERERAASGELLAAAHVVYSVCSDVYRSRSVAAWQAQIAAAEAATRLVREYQPAMVPGIVQTVSYTREMSPTLGRCCPPPADRC